MNAKNYLIYGLIMVVSLSGLALAQDADAQLPPPGITLLNGRFLWNLELFGEGTKSLYLLKIKRDPSAFNLYKLEKQKERIAEYAVVAVKDKDLAEEVFNEANKVENKIIAEQASQEAIAKHLEVLKAVQERLKENGLEPMGLKIAIANAEEKITAIEKMPKEQKKSIYGSTSTDVQTVAIGADAV